MTDKQLSIIDKWYENDYCGNSLLQKIVKKEIVAVGGFYQKDEDDFMSLANDVFFDSLKRWDGERNFKSYFVSNFKRKLASKLRDSNTIKEGGIGGLVRKSKYNDENDPTGELRYKEKENQIKYHKKNMTVSIDYVSEDETNLHEVITNGESIESILFNDDTTVDVCKTFLSKCSRMQRKILEFKMDHPTCLDKEICSALKISAKVYHEHMKNIKDNPDIYMLFV